MDRKREISEWKARFSLNVTRKEIFSRERAHLPRLQVRYLRYNEGWWLKQRAGRGLVDSPRPPIRRDLAGNPRPCNLLSAEGGLHHGESLHIPVREELRERGWPGCLVARVTTRWQRRLLLCAFLRSVYAYGSVYICVCFLGICLTGKRLENGDLERFENGEREKINDRVVRVDRTVVLSSFFSRQSFFSLSSVSFVSRAAKENKIWGTFRVGIGK